MFSCWNPANNCRVLGAKMFVGWWVNSDQFQKVLVGVFLNSDWSVGVFLDSDWSAVICWLCSYTSCKNPNKANLASVSQSHGPLWYLWMKKYGDRECTPNLLFIFWSKSVLMFIDSFGTCLVFWVSSSPIVSVFLLQISSRPLKVCVINIFFFKSFHEVLTDALLGSPSFFVPPVQPLQS